MRPRGILLYGPPASGKTTITHDLTARDPRIRLFERVKAGVGRSEGYRMSTPYAVDQLRAAGDIIFENHRYGSTYVIDRPGLTVALATGVPVIHLGQPEAIPAVTTAVIAADWLVVDLPCPRDITQDRLHHRGATDIPERLAAWEQTPRLDNPDLAIDTSITSPEDSAARIAALAGAMTHRHPA